MRKSLLFFLLASFTFSLFSCGEDDDSSCASGAVIHSFTETTKGTYHYDSELDTYYIRYVVPETIDSFYVGYLCQVVISDFAFSEGMTILFIGDFTTPPAGFSPSTQIGGVQFFYFDVLTIIPDNGL